MQEPTCSTILAKRGYTIKTSQFNPQNDRLDSLLELDRELDPETLREVKNAGYSVFKQI